MVKVIDDTEVDLRALIERDLGPLSSPIDLRSLLHWLHFRARSIPQHPRNVIMSPEVTAKLGAYPAISKIRDELVRGNDLSPWLSNRVRVRRADPKADLLFNDWQISHFHLGRLFYRKDKICRTDDLLFAYIGDSHAVLLDVHPHPRPGCRDAWVIRNLLQILLRVSPSDMERCEIKGSVGPNFTDEQIVGYREAGMTYTLEIGGRSFMPPGMGLCTSQHSTRIKLDADRMMGIIAKVRTEVENNRMQMPLLRIVSRSISMPVRLGVRLTGGRLMLYDKSRNLDIALLIAIA